MITIAGGLFLGWLLILAGGGVLSLLARPRAPKPPAPPKPPRPKISADPAFNAIVVVVVVVGGFSVFMGLLS